MPRDPEQASHGSKAMAFTAMCFFARYLAIIRVRCTTPAFEAAYE
jgi:hypothetical protein